MAVTPAVPVPLVDLGAWFHSDDHARRAVARKVDDARGTSGFLLVSGHGVPTSVRTAARAAARQWVQPIEHGGADDVHGGGYLSGKPSQITVS